MELTTKFRGIRRIRVFSRVEYSFFPSGGWFHLLGWFHHSIFFLPIRGAGEPVAIIRDLVGVWLDRQSSAIGRQKLCD